MRRPAAHLRELGRVVRTGGRLLLGFRPKVDGLLQAAPILERVALSVNAASSGPGPDTQPRYEINDSTPAGRDRVKTGLLLVVESSGGM